MRGEGVYLTGDNLDQPKVSSLNNYDIIVIIVITIIVLFAKSTHQENK
jgi:hypothetical protein